MRSIFLSLMLVVFVSCSENQYALPPESESDYGFVNSLTSDDQGGNFSISLGNQNSIDGIKLQDESKLLAGNFPPPQQPKTNQSPQEAPKKDPKKIIKTASLSLEVDDYMKATEDIKKIIEDNGAYISKEQEMNQTYRIENSLVIRVQPEKLDSIIAQIAKIAKSVVHKSIEAKDVTKQFVDLEIRQKSKREVIQRYKEILKQANTVKDILAVEAELRKVIEELEATEGQLKYLRDQVGLSTLNLSYYENRYKEEKRESFFSNLGDAFSDGWSGLLVFIVGMISIWPFVIIIGATLYFTRKAWKRRKTKNKN